MHTHLHTIYKVHHVRMLSLLTLQSDGGVTASFFQCPLGDDTPVSDVSHLLHPLFSLLPLTCVVFLYYLWEERDWEKEVDCDFLPFSSDILSCLVPWFDSRREERILPEYENCNNNNYDGSNITLQCLCMKCVAAFISSLQQTHRYTTFLQDMNNS